MSDSQYGVRIATSKDGNAYIAGLYGKDGVAQKLKAMGLERNEFQKWIKQGAIIVARQATITAPVQTGRLAESIRGYAGKKITPNNAPARYLFGGVIVAGPNVRGKTTTYGKSVSFGRYYKNIAESTVNSLSRRRNLTVSTSLFSRRTSGRTQGNPYIRDARESKREEIVKMWNYEIGRWIERNGFDTTGFGG
jgi:hypothetical protein